MPNHIFTEDIAWNPGIETGAEVHLVDRPLIVGKLNVLPYITFLVHQCRPCASFGKVQDRLHMKPVLYKSEDIVMPSMIIHTYKP